MFCLRNKENDFLQLQLNLSYAATQKKEKQSSEKTDVSLMQVESIAFDFRPPLSDNLS